MKLPLPQHMMLTPVQNIPLSVIYFFIVFLLACRPSEKLNVPEQPAPKMDSLETYIHKNFTKKYGMRIQYKFRYINTFDFKLISPLKKLVKPYVVFMDQYWIEPYLRIKGGKSYFETYAPNELVLSGTTLYNTTFGHPAALGAASGGTVVLVGRVNEYDLGNQVWTLGQLRLLTHEFAHIQHQVFNFPIEWGNLSVNHSRGMTGVEALGRGFVTAYAGTNASEDFAETVTELLSNTSPTSNDLPTDVTNILSQQGCLGSTTSGQCRSLIKGSETIKKKIEAVKKFYQEYGNINLEELRDSMKVVQKPLLYAP